MRIGERATDRLFYQGAMRWALTSLVAAAMITKLATQGRASEKFIHHLGGEDG